MTKAPKTAEIPALTGIRGVAACLVAIFHMNYWVDTGQWSSGNPDLFFGTVFRAGYLSVDLFFVLSGYVIAHAYLDWFKRPSVGTYGRFLARRVARIWPLHVLCLLWFLGAPNCNDASAIGANIVMVHSWGFLNTTTCNEPSWSISCEFLAYIAFPAIACALLALGRGWRALPLAGVGLAALAALSWLNPDHSLNLTFHLGIVRALGGFSIGAALCCAFADRRPSLVFDAIGLLSLGGACALTAMGVADFWVVCLFGPVVISVALSTGPLKRMLSFAPVVFLGEISYSLYMLHHAMINYYKDLGGAITTPLRAALVLAVICVAASASYFWIERPARRGAMALLNRLATDRRRWSPRQPAARGARNATDR